VGSALYKPIAAGLAVLVGLLITPTFFPWIPWQAVVPLVGLVAYLAYDPAQTIKGFTKAYSMTIGKLNLIKCLHISYIVLLMASVFSLAILFNKLTTTRPNESLFTYFAYFMLVLQIFFSYVIWFFYLVNDYFSRTREFDGEREKLRYLIGLNILALPVIGWILFLLDTALELPKYLRETNKFFRKLGTRVWLFVTTFISLIHKHARVVCMIDAMIGFMVSYRLFVQVLDLETVRYLIAGALFGYCFGLVHNLVADKMRSLARARRIFVQIS